VLPDFRCRLCCISLDKMPAGQKMKVILFAAHMA
jgi:hypothetical protein